MQRLRAPGDGPNTAQEVKLTALSGRGAKFRSVCQPSLRLAPCVLPTAGWALHIRWSVRKALEARRINVDSGGDFLPRPRAARGDHTHVTPSAFGHNTESLESRILKSQCGNPASSTGSLLEGCLCKALSEGT